MGFFNGSLSLLCSVLLWFLNMAGAIPNVWTLDIWFVSYSQLCSVLNKSMDINMWLYSEKKSCLGYINPFLVKASITCLTAGTGTHDTYLKTCALFIFSQSGFLTGELLFILILYWIILLSSVNSYILLSYLHVSMDSENGLSMSLLFVLLCHQVNLW